MPTLSYQLSDRKSTLIKLVESIPHNWKIFEVGLTAPGRLYHKGKIMPNTRLVIYPGYPFGDLSVVSLQDIPYEELPEGYRYNNEGNTMADFYGLFDNKMFSSIVIRETFRHQLHSNSLKYFVKSLLNKGYRGKIYAANNQTLTQSLSLLNKENIITLFFKEGKKDGIEQIVKVAATLGLKRKD